ncbi:MAG: sel1 repeat family protein [Endomicrobium sp.]|jgi:TPR repeat protein|nr:sel1 repeat family protein [Endomicrobium sp.]
MENFLSITVKVIVRLVLIIAVSAIAFIALHGYDTASVIVKNFAVRFKYEAVKIYYGKDAEKIADLRKKTEEYDDRASNKLTDISILKQIKKSAKSGSAENQFILAGLYYLGIKDVKQDRAEAVKWYERAAGQGHKAAQEMLGKIAAYEQTKKSAEEGSAESQFKLAQMYDSGYGIGKDSAEAFKWYQKAAGQGHAEAKKIADAINFEQTKKSEEENRIKLAEENRVKAEMYYRGTGVKQDYAEAAVWYKKAAEQGLSDAQYALGGIYYNGLGAEENPKEAFKWYKKAADQGHSGAQYAIGTMYYDGLGVTRRYGGAVNWYKKAAQQGHAGAQYALGGMYYDGRGIIQDYDKALHWYKKAAEQGSAEAQKKLDEIERN